MLGFYFCPIFKNIRTSQTAAAEDDVREEDDDDEPLFQFTTLAAKRKRGPEADEGDRRDSDSVSHRLCLPINNCMRMHSLVENILVSFSSPDIMWADRDREAHGPPLIFNYFVQADRC